MNHFYSNCQFNLENFKTKKNQIMGMLSNNEESNNVERQVHFMEKINKKKNDIMNALESLGLKSKI